MTDEHEPQRSDRPADGGAGIRDEAIDWLLRARSAPDDPKLDAALTAWLQADAAHAEAYRRAERVWALTGDARPAHADRWRKDAVEKDTVATAGRRVVRLRPGVPRRTAALGALAACLALLFVASAVEVRRSGDLATGVAEVLRHELPDGSAVTLNAESAVDTDYSGTGRRLTLLAGEAFFEVRPDKDRPFTVVAGRAVVTVTGTAFGTRMSDDAVTVEVAHGSVLVTDRDSAVATRVSLEPGQRLAIDRGTGAFRRLDAPASQIAAWRRGLLIVDQGRLGDVVDRIRPYLAGRLFVTDDRILDRRVSGVFDLRRPVDALRAAVQPHHGRVYELTPLLTVLTPD